MRNDIKPYHDNNGFYIVGLMDFLLKPDLMEQLQKSEIKDFDDAVSNTYCRRDSALFETETNLYNRSVLYAYSPRSTAKTVAIATKVAVRFGNFNINVYLCSAKTVAIATKVAVRIV